MTDVNPASVEAAFEILLEEIEAEIEFLNKIGAGAFENREYEKAKNALEDVAYVTEFREKINQLSRNWQSAYGVKQNSKEKEKQSERQNLGRLRRGLRTREDAYYQPILEALEGLGGSASMSDVLDHVFKNMKDVLRDVDYEPLASDPGMPRWRSTAQWARNSMVKEGALLSDSPRGVWEISDLGRKLLNKNKILSRS
jgi:restriction system protein